MKKIILTALITSAAIITFYSFHTMKYIDGKIDIREKGEVYIVNVSPTKSYRFTVKKTTTTNDTLVTYNIDYVELSPGDEQRLGGISSASEIKFPTVDSAVFKIYTKNDSAIHSDGKVINEDGLPILNKRNPKLDAEIQEGLRAAFSEEYGKRDTIINGDSVKYKIYYEEVADRKHPLPTSRFLYKYEVTGQFEIKPTQIR